MHCPLCLATHPITQSARGKDYVHCHEAHSTIWLTSPIVRRNLGISPNKGGYTARENPEKVVETYGPVEEDGDEGEWPRALPARSNPAPLDLGSISLPELGEPWEVTMERQRLLMSAQPSARRPAVRSN